QRRTARTLEEVLGDDPISGPLTRLQCCPVGEGAAAAIVASEDAIERLGPDGDRAVRVLSSASRSETIYDGENFDAALTRETTPEAASAARAAAGLGRNDLDGVAMRDAFTVAELLSVGAMGLAPAGGAAVAVGAGEFDIGWRVAVSASGGLLSMGHPVGLTDVG